MEVLEILNHVRLNFSPPVLLALYITIAIVLFGVALDIKLETFKELVLHLKGVLVGVLFQFFLVPVAAFLFNLLLNLAPTVAMGMTLIPSCPGGKISNFPATFLSDFSAWFVLLGERLW